MSIAQCILYTHGNAHMRCAVAVLTSSIVAARLLFLQFRDIQSFSVKAGDRFRYYA